MAAPDTCSQALDRGDRPGRRRPFSTWMKKLTNFKGSSSAAGDGLAGDSKRSHMKKAHKKRSKKNNPYPQSGRIDENHSQNGPQAEEFSTHSFTTAPSGSATSIERDDEQDRPPHTAGGTRSLAPTVATDNEGHHSMAAPSHRASSVAGTSRTVGGIESRRGGDSTFSSPAPSVRSLTTTLTTIQSSMAPNAQGGGGGGGGGGGVGLGTGGATGNSTSHNNYSSGHNSGQTQSIQFNQPFPTASPASAIPSHLAPSSNAPGHPTTYSSATANNLLTDNASILTLASSSKRRRRRSMDTDASVRAMAPSSLWGGSRESLPLSVLSANVEHAQAGGMPSSSALHQSGGTPNPRGLANASAERTSIYSATGVAPALPTERNSSSFYAKRDADGASTRSGLIGHGRADSVSGSIGGVSSPLVSPRERADGKPGGEAKDGEEASASKDNQSESASNGKENGGSE